MNSTSKIIEEAVSAFSALPGIGRKTAMRLVLHLARGDKARTRELARAMNELSENLKSCTQCFSYCDGELCLICSDNRRNHRLVCVVESIRDLMAIEETQTFRGVYLVLGGLISPIDGIGPDKLHINPLFDRIKANEIDEIILAVRPTIEGDTTAYYIHKNLPDPSVKVSMLARGVSFGSELEYADELTLGRSLVNRTPYTLADQTTTV